MKTYILYAMYGGALLGMAYGLFGGMTFRNRRWPWLTLGSFALIPLTLLFLKPAIDESWGKIETEQLRIELRSTRNQLAENAALSKEQAKTLAALRLQLEAQQLAQSQYIDAARSLVAQINDFKDVLQVKGIAVSNLPPPPRPSFEATPIEWIKHSKDHILSLYNLEVDRAQSRHLLSAAVEFLDVFDREFPNKTRLTSNWSREATQTSTDPASELDKLLTELKQVRGTNAFLNNVYTELNGSLDYLKVSRPEISAPPSRSSIVGFLASEADRQNFVLKAVQDLRALRISDTFATSLAERTDRLSAIVGLKPREATTSVAVSPVNPNSFIANLDQAVTSLSEGIEFSAVRQKIDLLRTNYQRAGQDVTLPEDRRIAIGTSQSGRQRALLYIDGMLERIIALGVSTPLATTCQPSQQQASRDLTARQSTFRLEPFAGQTGERAVRLLLLSTDNTDGLNFRAGSYLLDDPYIALIKPLLRVNQHLEQEQQLQALRSIRVKGYADQRESSNRLYRTDILPDYLRDAMRISSDPDYVRNTDLPNLRSRWIARVLSQFFPGVSIDVVDGEMSEGTQPTLRTVDITLHW